MLGSTAAADEPSAQLSFGAWKRLPTFDRGRMMPVDTFARGVVEQICGRTSPRLHVDEGTRDEPRKFSAAELLFSWMVEPKRWERVPFLHAEHERLRSELLGLPLGGEHGRLKHVSPHQLLSATKFRLHLGDMARRQREAEKQNQPFTPTELDKQANQLAEAYQLFRMLTYDPDATLDGQSRFSRKLTAAVHAWARMQADLTRWTQVADEPEFGQCLDRARQAIEKLQAWSRRADGDAEDIEPLVAEFREASDALARSFVAPGAAPRPDTPELSQQQRTNLDTSAKVLAGKTRELASLTADAHRALYQTDGSLRIVPALNPAALEADRDTSDDAHPWLALSTLLHGSPSVLAAYPREEAQEVREAFNKAEGAYLDRESPDRAERFAAAMDRFAAAVRTFGEKIEPLRQQLPIDDRDEQLIALTAYPPPGSTELEVHYNASNPFLWSWIISLGALICFALAFGVLRKPMFWLGVVVLTIAMGWIVYGFAMRTYITGWAPVTNMFETVVFVALVVGLLGLWFALLPLLWPGTSAAWQATAFPFSRRGLASDERGQSHFRGEEASSEDDDRSATKIGTVPNDRRLRWAMLLPRIGLMVAVFYILGVMEYGSAGEYGAVISLTPKTDVGSSVPNANNLLTWSVGLGVLGLSVWYVPRFILVLVLSPVMIPWTLARQGLAPPVGEVMQRTPFLWAGTSVAFLASLVAYYAPIFHSDLGPLMPVLRNNFWLTLHVLTITASYGAGALAWGLGNIALGYYLLGRYPARPVATGEDLSDDEPGANTPSPHREPEVCATLARFNYKAMQVAVLFLAIGTILGGLWADVSWGRFWGWDPKEVWALISLLIYMALLHGRYVGWFRHFGLAVGAVFGATAILMAWYGVNYVLPAGLHSYGSGAGGQLEVGILVACNWLFVFAAAGRYNLENREPVAEPSVE